MQRDFLMKLRCSKCGQETLVREGEIRCACGQELAKMNGGLVSTPHVTQYWGEITQQEMINLQRDAEQNGWRAATEKLPLEMQKNIMSAERSAFMDVLPLPEGSRFLDIGAGLGAVATTLAQNHHVVALEGVRERAEFIALRGRQDGLKNLTVLNSNFAELALAPGQFDCITVIGVLEWAALFDLSLPPEEAQVKFMKHLQSLLAPGGMICLGIENRFGWAQFTGDTDHSGLPYTSLMPRWMANWVCQRSEQYRSTFNTGYRTYTYSYGGYQRLFQSAGLNIANFWIAPRGYHAPTNLVPIHGPAIQSYVRQHWLRPEISASVKLRNKFKQWLAVEWFWRSFGSDYMFLLSSK